MSAKKKATRHKSNRTIQRVEIEAPQPITIPAEGLLNTDQAAAVLGIKPATLVTARCTKKTKFNLPYAKLGGAVRYRREDLDAFIEQSMVTG